MKFEEIVIGNELRAFQFSFFNSLPIIFQNIQPPFFLDKFKKSGIRKLPYFNNLIFNLSLNGLVIGGDKIQSIQLTSNNSLKLIVEYAREIDVEFETLHVFPGDYEIMGIPFDEEKTIKTRDWFQGETKNKDFLSWEKFFIFETKEDIHPAILTIREKKLEHKFREEEKIFKSKFETDNIKIHSEKSIQSILPNNWTTIYFQLNSLTSPNHSPCKKGCHPW